MFKWICLALGVVATALLIWMINDVRIELKTATRTVNERLPEIIANTKTTTETLADLSGDIKQIKDLAGIRSGGRDETLVAYADSVLDTIESSGAQIGLTKKVFGSGLKELVPADEWVVGARREALWLTMSSENREEVVRRLCHNKFGSQWYILFESEEATPLLDWLTEHHAATGELTLNDKS